MSRSQNSFWTFPQPPKKPIRAPKRKNYPKIKLKSIVRIKRNKENESCSTEWLDPKTVFEPFPNPKNSSVGPQKVKIESKSNVIIERNKENESCSTSWVDPKKVDEPYPNPTNSPLGPQKVKNNRKIKSKSNVSIEENKENEN